MHNSLKAKRSTLDQPLPAANSQPENKSNNDDCNDDDDGLKTEEEEKYEAPHMDRTRSQDKSEPKVD
jgi:hypothetical protein